MKKFLVGSALVLSAIGFVACGETTESTGLTNCKADTDCAATELCNTQAGVCLTKCEQASECPATAKNCAAIPAVSDGGAPGSSGKVCQCSTSPLCNADSSTSLICHSLDKTCENKCADDSACSGFSPARKCNTTTGECVPSTTTVDAGTPDSGPTTCTPGSCGTGKACDKDTNLCVAAACDSAAAEPSTCGYGSVCYLKSAGNEATVCLTATMCSGAKATVPTAGASPVIYGVKKTTTRNSSVSCTTGVVQKFEGSFYDPQGDMPTSNLYSGKKIQIAGSGSFSDTYQNLTITGTTTGTFTFELCTDNVNSKGVFIVDSAGNNSNVECVTVP